MREPQSHISDGAPGVKGGLLQYASSGLPNEKGIVMKALKIALCAAAASFAMAGAAAAQDGPELSYNIGVTTDYVFRGFTQTGEDPAVFGGIDLGYGMFYAGTWASSVDFG